MATMQLSEELVQAIANYLSTKPFNEVQGFIGAIQKEAMMNKMTPPPPPKSPVPNVPTVVNPLPVDTKVKEEVK